MAGGQSASRENEEIRDIPQLKTKLVAEATSN
jgi:hypothetical protein